MNLIRRPAAWVLFSCTLLFVVFVFWYRGSQTPLTAAEQQNYLARLQAMPESARNFVDEKSTRAFMHADDGKPFYVVNLFQFREQADYGEINQPPLSGFQAFNLFSRQAVPIWAKHGTHPVFVTRISGRFSNDWDWVSIVRYRSRRDFMEIQTNGDFINLLPHRLAATQDNIRLRLSGIVLPSPTWVVFIFLFGAWWFTWILIRRQK